MEDVLSPGIDRRRGNLARQEAVLAFEKLEGEMNPLQLASRDLQVAVMGPNAMILVFVIMRFKLAFSISSFTLIKRLFISSLLSAIRVVSSTYLRLFVFLLAILIPAYNSSSLGFYMMYSAYKLNRQLQYTALSYSFPNV